jgi:hypothetical protein
MDTNLSFDSVGFSDDEKDEIEEKLDSNNNKKEEDNPFHIKNYNLIKSISQTLLQILENNRKMSNYKKVIHKQIKSPFSSNIIPKISLEDYLLRIQAYSNMEKSTLIIGLIFIDKLCNISDIVLTYYNIHRIVFSALLISIKYNEDSFYDNKYYSEIAGVNLKELKMLEYSFTTQVNFNLFVNKNIYEKYENYLEHLENL